MDELQSQLSSLLENPAELERLTQMASQLLGGGEASEPEPTPSAPMPDLGGLLARFRASGSSDTQKLLAALRPFLAPKRQEKLSRAMRVARLASVAQVAMERMGEEEADEPLFREHGSP